jgi:glycosyltransferase involved in cell wall biosynthesis
MRTRREPGSGTVGQGGRGESMKRKNRTRVLFLLRTTGFGGMEVMLLDWLSELDFSAAEVTLATTNSALCERLAELGFPVKTLPLPEKKYLRRGVFERLARWWWLMRSERPDTVAFLEGSPPPDFDLMATLAAFLVTRRRCYFFQGLAPSRPEPRSTARHFGFLPGLGLYWRARVLRMWLRAALSRTLVASGEIARRMTEWQSCPKANLRVAYHGVDCERFKPSPASRARFREAHGIPAGAVLVTSHARVVRQKRLDRLIEAFDTAAGEHGDLWLALTATAPLPDEVGDAVARMAHGSRVRLVGFQRDPSELLAASDIYVMASDNEGFGIALVEAMATGLLCVATEVPGPVEVLAGGRGGILVSPTLEGVLDGLQQAIKIFRDGGAALRSAARAEALERFEVHTQSVATLREMGLPTAPAQSLPLAPESMPIEKGTKRHATHEELGFRAPRGRLG